MYHSLINIWKEMVCKYIFLFYS